MINAIRILKNDFDILEKNIEFNKDLFLNEPINDNECKLIFISIEKALEFDEMVKDKLIYKGFDKDYNPTRFGGVCENIIYKMNVILK
jgi:hypothetical protein